MVDNPAFNKSTWTIPVSPETESHPDLVEVSSRSTYLKRAASKGPEPNVQRRLLIGIACLALTTGVLVIAVGILSHYYNETKILSSQPIVCTSNECVETAANILESLDLDVNPCEDFYKFSCGKWAEKHPVPDFSVSTDWFYERKLFLDQRIHEMLERNFTKQIPDPVVQARRLYQSCLNTDEIDQSGLQPILEILHHAGLPEIPDFNGSTPFNRTHSYPILSNGTSAYGKFKPTNLHAGHRWLAALVGSRRVVGKDHLIGFGVFPHPMNRTINVLTVGSPNMQSPLPDYDPRIRQLRGRVRGWRWQEKPSWAGRYKSRKVWTKSSWQRRSIQEEDEDEEEEGDEEGGDDNKDDNIVSTRLKYIENAMRLMNVWNSIQNISIDDTAFVDFVLKKLSSDNDNEGGKEDYIKKYAVQIDELSEAVLKLYLQAVQEEAERDSDSLNGLNRPPPFHEMELSDLQRLTDDAAYSENSKPEIHIDWKTFFALMFEGIDVSLDFKTDMIMVQDLNYLKNLAKLLAKTSPSVVEGLIWWEVIYVLSPHSNSVMRHLHSSYIEKITGGEVPRSRAMSCAVTTNEMMGMAVSWLLADEELNSNKSLKLGESVNAIEKTKKNVDEMLTDIKETFYDLVDDLDWMDQETKSATLKKAKAMKSFIAYPSWLMSIKDLEFYYEGLQIFESGYLNNLLNVIQIGTIWSLKDLRLENDIDTWATDPTDVNAFHTFQDNAVTIPAGILQFPFYGLGLEALNYGAIGSVLGHELTHGFDNSGRNYDENGNWRQWWSNRTINEYLNRTSCFVDQYSSYWMSEGNAMVNGKRTLGENIADNGGLQESIRAFKRYKQRNKDYRDIRLPGLEQFSQDHLLFFSFANLWCEHGNQETAKWIIERDEHSPSKARVWGTISNSKEFSKLFKCPTGSPMNPEEKCRIW